MLGDNCPQCDVRDLGAYARDQLEVLILRGGRRGKRLARAVRPLDERFYRATTQQLFVREGGQWWRRRNLGR